MKKKTALQVLSEYTNEKIRLIEEWREDHLESQLSSAGHAQLDQLIAFRWIINNLLPAEREQIETAVKHGKSFGQHMTPTDYFIQTYEQ